MLKFQFVASSFKIFMEFRSVVGLNVFNVSGNEILQAVQKVGSVTGVGFQIHSSKSHLGKEITAGKNVTFEILFSQFDGIETQQETGTRLFLEPGDSFLFLSFQAFPGGFNGLGGIRIKLVLLNHSLDFPTGNPLAIFLLVKLFDFELGIAEISFSKT
jgi:hypothetical protein